MNTHLDIPVIVIVDDDELDRMIIRRAIQTTVKDCEFCECSTPKEALTLLDNRAADLVISDVNMGLYSGFELVETINNSGLDRVPKIILMSGHVSEDDALKAKTYTPLPLLTKPMSGEQSQIFGRAIADCLSA